MYSNITQKFQHLLRVKVLRKINKRTAVNQNESYQIPGSRCKFIGSIQSNLCPEKRREMNYLGFASGPSPHLHVNLTAKYVSNKSIN